jgi:hypothetical protein
LLELLGHEHREVDYAEGEDVHIYEADKEALDAAICKVLRVHPQNERAYHYYMHGLVDKEDDLSCLILLHNQSQIVDQCHQIPQVVAAQNNSAHNDDRHCCLVTFVCMRVRKTQVFLCLIEIESIQRTEVEH